ncbi:hypothetical protein STRAU_6012 [Streptomyces aurantiacus JA 4570]|uniref:Uncharacterized protein n=1 Tax=Streptomyces aurantiacus JA 4570 TaxID=1286094 RepID=S3ZB39_9ACTN|nr:hypothetical protein STRAU_6012 [Streptomyces aurantiacus JA 4570]
MELFGRADGTPVMEPAASVPVVGGSGYGHG